MVLDMSMAMAVRLRCLKLISFSTLDCHQLNDVHAMTANAITSVSLNPPLLLFCVNKEAVMAREMMANQQFTINVLAEEQSALGSAK